MRLLLDTRVFLWALSGSPHLKGPARALIQSADVVSVSAASIWEIAIKASLEKSLRMRPKWLQRSSTAASSVKTAHAVRVTHLPNHHDDPFDRLLIAQAVHEPLHPVTADRVLTHYSDLVMLV